MSKILKHLLDGLTGDLFASTIQLQKSGKLSLFQIICILIVFLLRLYSNAAQLNNLKVTRCTPPQGPWTPCPSHTGSTRSRGAAPWRACRASTAGGGSPRAPTCSCPSPAPRAPPSRGTGPSSSPSGPPRRTRCTTPSRPAGGVWQCSEAATPHHHFY